MAQDNIEKDRELLAALMLDKCTSVLECRDKIATLGMRQLDRLKLMLVRKGSSFGPGMNERIRRNDLDSFAEATFNLLVESGIFRAEQDKTEQK